MKSVRDATLAYTFDYPAATLSGKPLPLVFSRKPERYSSAAPLTADARQRIVCELADLIDAVTVSLTVRGSGTGGLAAGVGGSWAAAWVRGPREAHLVDGAIAHASATQLERHPVPWRPAFHQ